ncbi:cobalt ABC transporter [Propionibacteriaceae bacterium G1746]
MVDQSPHHVTHPDTITRIAERTRELSADHPRLVLLIDGGSGAGKTSLATELVAHLRATSPDTQLVSLDSCYPGWQGLAEGAAMVPDMLRAVNPGHPTWDWAAHRPDGWVGLDPVADIVIEGCGALTPENRALATAGLWMELDPITRRERALDRDGEGYRPWWDLWAAQELVHWQRHHPWRLADMQLNVAPHVTPAVPYLRW